MAVLTAVTARSTDPPDGDREAGLEPPVPQQPRSGRIWRGPVACPRGIEPLTHSLEGCCSIHLSYGQPLKTGPFSHH